MIDLTKYNQSQLSRLTTIVSGDGNPNAGNIGIAEVSQTHRYTLNGIPYLNVVGPDGVYKLYNQSQFISDEQVKDAATYWNKLTGKEIVQFVANKGESDQVIWDSVDSVTGILGIQSYTDGITIYPSSWMPEYFTDTELNLAKVALIIHEVGHGLGIPHLGGGLDGEAAASNGYPTSEVMSAWSPFNNTNGIISTKEDAAALAIAALSYQKPQKLCAWVLGSNNWNVNYSPSKEFLSTIPIGVQIDTSEIYIDKYYTAKTTAKVLNNYNVYTVDNNIIDQKEMGEATVVNTLLNMNLINSTVNIIAVYTSTISPNSLYYRFEYNNQSYVANALAFDRVIANTGMTIDVATQDWTTNYSPINQSITKIN